MWIEFKWTEPLVSIKNLFTASKIEILPQMWISYFSQKLIFCMYVSVHVTGEV